MSEKTGVLGELRSLHKNIRIAIHNGGIEDPETLDRVTGLIMLAIMSREMVAPIYVSVFASEMMAEMYRDVGAAPKAPMDDVLPARDYSWADWRDLVALHKTLSQSSDPSDVEMRQEVLEEMKTRQQTMTREALSKLLPNLKLTGAPDENPARLDLEPAEYPDDAFTTCARCEQEVAWAVAKEPKTGRFAGQPLCPLCYRNWSGEGGEE